MPEYRRFIAYFYEYIDGKKQKNTGFAKVELRNGTWRILFRLTAPVHPRPPIEVYGFVREGDDLLGLPMGNMRAGREMMEEWAYHDETLWMGKYGLSDFSGIWIRSGDGRHFITVWDEEPVAVGRFVTEIPKEEIRRTAGRHAENEASEEPESTGKERESRETAESEQELQPETADGITEPQGMPVAVAAITDTDVVSDAATETPNMESKTAAAVEIPETETVYEADPQKEKSESEKTDESDKIDRTMQTVENQKIWENIYKKSIQFHPFADQEITACIRVAPEDILQLQRAHWRTGRNSFLMHGYYNYRHLLIGKTEDGKYVLGVPGIMNPQEKYLAVMFGFPDFKFSDVLEQNPAGGYWYRILEQGQLETPVS